MAAVGEVCFLIHRVCGISSCCVVFVWNVKFLQIWREWNQVFDVENQIYFIFVTFHSLHTDYSSLAI